MCPACLPARQPTRQDPHGTVIGRVGLVGQSRVHTPGASQRHVMAWSPAGYIPPLSPQYSLHFFLSVPTGSIRHVFCTGKKIVAERQPRLGQCPPPPPPPFPNPRLSARSCAKPALNVLLLRGVGALRVTQTKMRSSVWVWVSRIVFRAVRRGEDTFCDHQREKSSACDRSSTEKGAWPGA